jgi:hypothetical protein
MREMRLTETVRFFARIWQRIVMWSRRTFIGDRVFMSFGIIDLSYSLNSPDQG